MQAARNLLVPCCTYSPIVSVDGLTTQVVPSVVGATAKVRSAEFYSSGSRVSYNWLYLISNATLIVVNGT